MKLFMLEYRLLLAFCSNRDILLSIGFAALTKRRYNDIDALNSYLVKVLAGDEAPGILDQEAG